MKAWRPTILALGALAAALAGAAEAGVFAAIGVTGTSDLSGDWQVVGHEPDKARYEFDRASIRIRGPYVSSISRITFPAARKEASTGREYTRIVSRRLDDCAKGRSATVSYLYLDQEGRTVLDVAVPGEQFQLVSFPAGGIGKAFLDQVCAALPGAPSRPALPLSPNSQVTWAPTGASKSGDFETFLAEESLTPLAEGGVSVILKEVSVSSNEVRPGVAYNTALKLVRMDCQGRAMGVGSSDFYDVDGRLVLSLPVAAIESPRMETVTTGTSAEGLWTAACRVRVAMGGAHADPSAMLTITGTGWLGPKGYLITANHVVDGAVSIELRQDGKRVGTAEVVVNDPANDVAILKPHLDGAARTAIPLSETPAELGERVFTLGFPRPRDLGVSLKMTSGEISSVAGSDAATGRNDDLRFMQISVPVQSGNSGGPVLDGTGHAVGVVDSKTNDTPDNEILQNANYAVKTAYVRPLLAELPDLGGYRYVKPATTVVGLVAELKDSIFQVVVQGHPHEH